jgi:hypothetical protein
MRSVSRLSNSIIGTEKASLVVRELGYSFTKQLGCCVGVYEENDNLTRDSGFSFIASDKN